jgi:hypothetical protein
LDEPETKKIVRERKKSGRNHKGSWRSLPLTRASAASFRLLAGLTPVATTHHQFFGCAGDGGSKLRLAKA